MSFAQKFMPSFLIGDDPFRKQLKKANIYTDDLSQKNMQKGMQIFHKKQQQNKQQQILKSIMKLMQQKTSHCRKLKLICYLIQISKKTKYDVADILINKKIKLFTKSNIKVKLLPTLDKNSLEQYIYIELIIPFYNYFMKLSLNEQLYNTCLTKQIPNDDVFRRGTKIRFIWIFKIYNLIHILIPILQTILKFIKVFPQMKYFLQIFQIYFLDLIIMNNFIVKAIQQAADDNYILMPYFDMLQFYQSLTEQLQTSKKIFNIHSQIKKYIPEIQTPLKLKISQQQISQIQVQSLRVKLISNTLKNPKKDHTRLQTQYNIKSEITEIKKKNNNTEGNYQPDQNQDIQKFKQKYRNLDLVQNKNIQSLQEEEQQDEEIEQNYK